MGHPFVIGSKYRNRDGEYTVVKLNPPNMLIRYVNGTTITTTIALQERIWENLQLESEVEEETPVAKSARQLKSPPQVKEKYGEDFHGLVDSDFKLSIEGTTWRARSSLGGLLARRLSAVSGREFESHAIYRRAEVHVVQPQSFEPNIRVHEAKFFFKLDAKRVHHGFYIEKNWDEMDNTWDWLRFTASFKQHSSIWDRLPQTMAQHKLVWEAEVKAAGQEHNPAVYRYILAGQPPLRYQHAMAEQRVTWPVFADVLKRIEPSHWCDLYLLQEIEKQEAIKLGIRIADRVVETWNLLVPLYLATVQRPSS
jgi:hypothetical protein